MVFTWLATFLSTSFGAAYDDEKRRKADRETHTHKKSERQINIVRNDIKREREEV